MYTPKYYTRDECFPTGMQGTWKLMDDRILKSADKLREVFGPLSCNTGKYTQCGYRTNGSLTSQHRFGRAMDLHSSKHPYWKMRRYIISHPEEFPYITFLEVDINWLHLDVRNCKPLTLWSPKRGFLTESEYLFSIPS